MRPKLSDILKHAREFSHNIILQMPKNTNINNLMKIVSEAYGVPVAQVVRVMFNGLVSQLFVFLGDEAFIKVMYSTVYEMLYATLKCESKEDCERVKKAYRAEPDKVLCEAFLISRMVGKKQPKRPKTPRLTLI